MLEHLHYRQAYDVSFMLVLDVSYGALYSDSGRIGSA